MSNLTRSSTFDNGYGTIDIGQLENDFGNEWKTTKKQLGND